MNHTEIKELMQWLEQSSFTTFSLSVNGMQLSVSKQQVVPYQSGVTLSENIPAVVTREIPVPAVQDEKPEEPEKPEKPGGHIVNSPIVGVFYDRPNPESPPFVQVGQLVSKGDTLCILEAMKIMNELYADADGVVTEIFVTNGSMVEACMPLIKIEVN